MLNFDQFALLWSLALLSAVLSGCDDMEEGEAWRLVDQCSAPMPMIACEGALLQAMAVSDVGECCDICAQTGGCRAYSYWHALPSCPEGLSSTCSGGAIGACHGGTAGNHSCLEPSPTTSVLQLQTQAHCDAGYSQCAFVDANQVGSTPGVCHLLRQCATLKLTSDSRLLSGTPFRPRGPDMPLSTTCANPVMGNLQACHGTALKVVETNTSVHEGMGQCCEECQKTENCTVYTHYVDTDVWGQPTGTASCHLMANCVSKGESWGIVAHTGWAPPQPLNEVDEPSPGYAVGRGVFNVSGYSCGHGAETVIFFPTGDGPYGNAEVVNFHVVVYGAGVWGFIDHNDELLETVARQGLIVIAPFYNTEGKACHTQDMDILLALHHCRMLGGSLHPALTHANFSSTGILGMSMGAKSSVVVGGRGEENVNAVVALGGARDGSLLKVPSMLVTGTLDGIEPSTKVKSEFDVSPTFPKIYVNLRNAFHTEPQEGRRMNELAGKFLACHVSGRKDACAAVYELDDGGIAAVCRENEYSECIVQFNATVASKVPATPTTTTLSTTFWPSLRANGSRAMIGRARWNLTRI